MKVLVTVLLALGLLGGCASEVPIPTAFEKSYQPKMWAAEHWDVLAANIAERLKTALAELQPNHPLVLHVRQPSVPTVFNETFHDLLETQLIQQGFGLSQNPDNADLELVVKLDYGGKADKDVNSGYTEITKNDDDMVINVSVLRGSRYVTRISELFYVDHTIGDEFLGKPPPPPTRLVDVVGPEGSGQ